MRMEIVSVSYKLFLPNPKIFHQITICLLAGKQIFYPDGTPSFRQSYSTHALTFFLTFSVRSIEGSEGRWVSGTMLTLTFGKTRTTEISAVCTGRTRTLWKFLGTCFCCRLSGPQATECGREK